MRKIRVTTELIPAEEGFQRMKILIPNRPKVIENVVQKMA
jgi:hypothetical protein